MKKLPYDYCLGSDDPQLKKQLTTAFSEAGFSASGEAKSAPELLRLLRLKSPWLAVIDPRIPPGRAGQLAAIIEEDGLAAPLFIGPGSRAVEGHVLLSWPADKKALPAVAEALCLEFSRKKVLQGKIDRLEQKLKERKLIEQAKGKLVASKKITEEAAFRLIQKKSMEERVSLGKIAERILNNFSVGEVK